MRRSLILPVVLTAAISVGQGFSLAGPQPQSPQAPARDSSAKKTGTARIRGRVTLADTGQPLRRAVVQLMSYPDGREQAAVMSDGDGKFEFASLPTGGFRILVTKDGFLAGRYGSRGPGDASFRTITLEDGQAIENAEVRVWHGGAISGRVLDEFGEPAVGVNVFVGRYIAAGTVRQLAVTGTSPSTDDLGHYRVYSLSPGTYYVGVLPPSVWPAELAGADRSGYARTYYPGSPDLAQAQAIRLEAGQEASGTDIMLMPVRLARVSGVVVDRRGRPVTSGSVAAVLTAGGRSFGGGGGAIQPDGTFLLSRVAPGEYVLVSRVPTPQTSSPSTAPPQAEVAYTRVVVAGEDVTGVVLQNAPGATLTGRLVFEGEAGARTSGNVVVSAAPADPTDPLAGSANQAANADGTFSLKGLFGSQLIRLSPCPAGWALEAVYVNDRDVVDSPIKFEGREELSDVRVVLTNRITRVTGSVVGDDGAPVRSASVVVLADDQARWGVRSRYQANAAYAGTVPFTIEGLPPGDYFAVAMEDSATAPDLLDEELVARLRKAGTAFSLKEGETRSLTLKMMGQ